MGTSLIELTAQRGRVRLTLRCLRMGKDLCLTLSGGEREHIGAVALSEPGPEEKSSAVTSVLALPGHREDELAKRVASQVASRLGVVVCVACGIHVEAILPSELADVLEMSTTLTQSLLERLSEQEH
jgi:gallate decarboxylase subunit D